MEHMTAALPEFKPLIGSFTSEISRLEEVHGLRLPESIALSGIEILAHNEDSCSLVVSAITLEDRRARPWFEARVFCGDDAHRQAILAALNGVPVLDAEIQNGTYREGALCDKLREKLAKESPVARKLASADTAAACNALYDDSLRNAFARLIDTLGLDPIPQEIWLRLFSDKGKDIGERMVASGLVGRRYLVRCTRCGEFKLAFRDKEHASQALDAADKRCRACGADKLAVQEAFVCSAEGHDASQGLWLEKLVADIVSPRAIETFRNRMLETNELDVVCVLAEKVTLFECKDKGIGQNDFYILSMKGQELGADRLVIVTTAQVHDNVQELVKRHNEGSDKREISLVTGETVEKIKAELNNLIDRWIANYGRRPAGPGWSFATTLATSFSDWDIAGREGDRD